MVKNRFWIALFLSPAIVLFSIVFAASLAMLLGFSFTDWRIGSRVGFVGLKNYFNLVNDADFRKGFLNTIIWIVLQITIHVSIGTLFALILVKKEFYWKFARTVYMIPNIISGAALGMLYLCVFNPSFGAVNVFIRRIGFKDFFQNWFMDYKTSFFSVTMTWLPFAAVVTILVMAELAAIPESIFESAKIDGAGEYKINIYIVLPMLRNIMGTCVILAGTSMLQQLDKILMTTGGGPGNETLNIPLYIYRTAFTENNFGYADTLGVVLVFIGIALVILIGKVFKIGTSQT